MLAKLLSTFTAIIAVNAKQITFNVPVEELGLETLTFDPGFNVDINFDIVKQAANVWFDELVSVLDGLTIPDYIAPNGHDYMKDNHFYIE
jgi:hypothetical protein